MGVPGSAPSAWKAGAAVYGGLLAIMAAGLVLRVYQIRNESAWWDEVVTLRCLDAPNVVDFLRAERASDPPMTPVYFVLAYFWSRLLSPSVCSMRLLSVILGVAAIPLMYRLARAFYGTTAGLIAALSLSLSLVHVYYSQEVRVYALVTLLSLCSVLFLWRAVAAQVAGLPSRSPWLAHLSVNALLIFTHLFAVLLILAEGCFLLVYHRRNRKAVSVWAAAHFVLVALLAAWLRTVDTASIHQAASWMVRPGIRELGMLPLVFCGGRPSNENPASHLPTGISLDGVVAGVVLLITAWFVAREIHARRWSGGRGLGLLLLWLALPPLMLAVASYVWRPCFVYRYVLYSSLPLSILLGGAFPAMRARSAKVCLGGLLALCALHQAAAVTAGPFRPDWQSVSRYLEAHATADDRVVVMQDINRWAFEFNTTLPRAQIQCAPVWSAVCGPVVEAHHQGRAAWVIVWLWSDPGNVEACFTKNAYPCTVQDFAGWPRLRLYYVPAEAQGT